MFECLAEMAASSKHREPLTQAIEAVPDVVIALADLSQVLDFDLVTSSVTITGRRADTR